MANNLLIFGDSYSTFEGYIPEGYAIYYHEGHSNTDVTKVTETWWHQVAKEADLNLVLNNSWSGSTIGYTGYNNADNSKSSSFVYRLNQLVENGFFQKNRIDTVFVFGGTNDSCANGPLGELDGTDLYCVLPAISLFFDNLRKTLPNADIYCLINTHLKPEVSAALKTVSERHGITPIAFEHIEKQNGHPTIKGMQEIKEDVLKALAQAK
jgi:lysophospholipase L1-like esterase